jgi:cytidyltransferase-like protein
MSSVFLTGSFDNLRSSQARFLEEASHLGRVHVLLWPDEAVAKLSGKPPNFPLEERLYLLQSIRYVGQVSVASRPIQADALTLPENVKTDIWAVDEASNTPQKRINPPDSGRVNCQANGITWHVIKDARLVGFPPVPLSVQTGTPARKKVLVTGCYDWFHSGHVRFFEEVSALGDLYVVVGHNANVRLLKGEGHPLFPQDERRYMVQSIRFVRQALVSSGTGWMDAEPEIELIKPDVYAVNEDGDKPEKREFCRQHGLQYAVLKRTPKEGLPRRQSTDLRGF